MIGNPVTDKINEFNSRVEYSRRFALLPDELYEVTQYTWVVFKSIFIWMYL